MKKVSPEDLQQKVDQLQKECAHLRRKIDRQTKQQIRQEKFDDINRHLLKHTNEKLLQYHEQIRLQNISKSNFLANMSHEIRTPLNIILGMANLLVDTELDQTQSKYLSSLQLTGRQLMEILNNILEFSRIEAGKISVIPEPFSLNTIINQIEASALPLCLRKKLDFSIKHDPLLVMERVGDSLKIFQILLNLINNAVKFTESGSVILEIKENFTQKESLLLNVIDTGIGISEDQQKIIFERFTQANDSLSQQHGGAGLGLAISKKLTEAMKGKLTVKSVLGRGSVFSCSLPLPAAAPSERRQLRFDASMILPEHFPELNILVVDDIKDNIDVIKVYLNDYPVHLQSAENGREALNILATGKFDIILMDIRMPVMNGITATQTIRNRERTNSAPGQLILAITAHAFQEQKNTFLQAGFSGVLTKPFFKRELIHTLYKFTKKERAAPSSLSMGNKTIGYCLEHGKPDDIPASLKHLIPDLLKTISGEIASINSAMLEKDYEFIYAKAHSLKGVAGMFGFQKLANLITDLSQSTKAKNFVVIEGLLPVLETYLVQLKKQFK